LPGSIIIFGELTSSGQVLADRPGVWNLQLESELARADENTPKRIMLYTVKAGANQDEHYGIDLARAMGFPQRFIQVAEKVSKSLRERREARKQSSEARKLVRRRDLINNLYELLQHASESDMDEPALASYLLRLRHEFILRMSALDETGTDELVDKRFENLEGNGAQEEYDDADVESSMASLCRSTP
jgi:DNA mismatch repair protein MSH4